MNISHVDTDFRAEQSLRVYGLAAASRAPQLHGVLGWTLSKHDVNTKTPEDAQYGPGVADRLLRSRGTLFVFFFSLSSVLLYLDGTSGLSGDVVSVRGGGI